MAMNVRDSDFDRFFMSAPWQRMSQWGGPSDVQAWQPRIDVSENDKALFIQAELPGMNKEDIKVEVENDMLTLSGEKKQEKKEENRRYHRVERSYGSFQRSMSLPPNTDPKTIKADFNHGVLQLEIPKPQQKTRTPHRVEW